MRVLLVLDEPILPEWSGNRRVLAADVAGLCEAGHEIDFVVFRHANDSTSTLPWTGGRCLFVDRRGFAEATLRCPLTPYQAASRRLRADELKYLAAEFRQPDMIIAEHEWTINTANALRAIAGWDSIPVILRSHNDEAEFMRAWASEQRGVGALYSHLEALRTSKIWVRRQVRAADKVWTLSRRDALFYKAAGRPAIVMPAAQPALPVLTGAGPNDTRVGVVGFLGSLNVPQAVAGLRWFLTQVWPEIRLRFPSAVFVVAGRNCPPDLLRALDASPGASYLGAVDSALETISQFTVFVNPVFSGSGVNIKLLDPIRLGVPVVTTSFGMRGFEDLDQAVPSADDPMDFADRVIDLLSSSIARPGVVDALRRIAGTFSIQSVAASMTRSLEDAII